ncbi:MAG: 50S ribosomal protein L25 [bacterium]|nr:50S ribosomal protein L25 [bacterium]
MDNVELSAQARDMSKTSQVLRRANTVPCVLYGSDVDNTQIQCVYNELFRSYQKAGASTLVNLEIDGKKVPVLFHALQFDPVSDFITHVDFLAVDMKKEIEATIPLQFEGEAPAVKDLGGVMVTSRDHVTVKCLPSDLPHSLSIDISILVDFTSALHVSDIIVPSGVVISEDDDVVLATVQEPRKETEPEAVEAVEGEEGEVAKGGDAEKSEGGDS